MVRFWRITYDEETTGSKLNYGAAVKAKKHNLRCGKLPQWLHSLHEKSKFRHGEINTGCFRLDIISVWLCKLRFLIAAVTKLQEN